MNLRQTLLEELRMIRSAPVVNINAFKNSYVRFKTCEVILMEYRNFYKVQGVA